MVFEYLAEAHMAELNRQARKSHLASLVADLMAEPRIPPNRPVPRVYGPEPRPRQLRAM
jgi:hypothetical protein